MLSFKTCSIEGSIPSRSITFMCWGFAVPPTHLAPLSDGPGAGPFVFQDWGDTLPLRDPKTGERRWESSAGQTISTAAWSDRCDALVHLVRAELLEGRSADAAFRGAGFSGPFWVCWSPMHRRRFYYWTNREAEPDTFHRITRGRIGQREATIEIELDSPEIQGYHMLHIWRVGGPPLPDLGRDALVIPTEVVVCR